MTETGGEITPAEYNAALRVAELEEMRQPFYKTTWSRVLVDDLVLMPWASLDRIVEVEIKQCVTEPEPDGKLLVIARFTAFGCEFGQSFDSDEIAYVQSRL